MTTTAPALPVERKLRSPATLVAAGLVALIAVAAALVGVVGSIGSTDDVGRSTERVGIIPTADAEERRAESVDNDRGDGARVGTADAAERWNDR